MARAVVIGVVAAAVVAGVVWWLRSQVTSPARSGPDRPRRAAVDEGRVVLAAFSRDWAKRFDVAEEDLSAALITGADAALAARVDAEVGVVDLRFDDAGGRRDVPVTLIVSYASTGERSTARLSLPWDDVPDGVRAELLRGGGSPVFRKWRPGT
jgi:hypothetical protein